MRPIIPKRSDSNPNLTPDLDVLISYLPRTPQLVQQQFLPYLQGLRKEQPQNQRLTQYLQEHQPNKQPPIDNAAPLVHNFAQLLQTKHLPKHLTTISDRLEAQQKQSKQAPAKPAEPEPFEHIDLLYPDYDSYYRMSKQDKSGQEKTSLGQHHPKNKSRDFFTEPRFLTRIEEFSHFRNGNHHKGDIVFLQYHGHTIASGKVHLVANQKSLELWGQETSNYPMPNLLVPTEEELEKKKEEDKKKELEKDKLEDIPTPFKLEFMHKFTGHTEKITCISLSQDEYYAITGSADRIIRLWCLRLKVCLAVYRGHTRTIWDVHFCPSGYYFLSGGGDGLMILWKTDEPHAQRIYQHDSDVYKVSFAKDPSYLVSAGEDATIRIWSTIEATLLRTIKLNEPVLNFSLGFSGAFLVAIESDGRVTVLNLLEGKTINSFYFHEPQSRSGVEETAGGTGVTGGTGMGKPATMKIHDVSLSEDEKELSCICAHYILVYSMEKLEKKLASNIYTFYQSNSTNDSLALVDPKEVLYLGSEANLTHCAYQAHNVLTVSGTIRH